MPRGEFVSNLGNSNGFGFYLDQLPSLLISGDHDSVDDPLLIRSECEGCVFVLIFPGDYFRVGHAAGKKDLPNDDVWRVSARNPHSREDVSI